MKFKIPKTFEVGGTAYTVELVPNLQQISNTSGQTHYDNGIIYIDANLQPEDLKALTFYHEVLHAILHTLGRFELRDDEGLVDSVAGLFWQINKTSKY